MMKKKIKKQKQTIEKTPLYTDGRVSEADQIEKVRNLEDLMGSRKNPFKSKSETELDKEIAAMTLPELQALAVSLGIFPSGTKTNLKQKIKKEFKEYETEGKGRVFQTTKPIADSSLFTEAQRKLFNIT